MIIDLYPKSPELQNYDFVRPSKEFKKTTILVILSILFFFLFYLILIIVAAVVMVAAGWAGITIISLRPGFITFAAGGGIIALGIMFFIFLFKFIFSSNKNENPQRMELQEREYPELFAFIRSLTADTKVKFPKKIFVSPDVNAMVFYNSSFWSLFFPVRKNLEIGLGLVNALNVSEFKAVLAHEFGHFSQQSMKAGSYIYTVNRVIYNLVYEYDTWDNWLSKWGEAGGIFGFFAGITFWLVERVRSLLKIAYNMINITYMKLSREMEYHADLVAVSVSGNKPFKSALRKIEFSSFVYDSTTACLNSLAAKEKSSANIYADHSCALSFYATLNKIVDTNGNLQITDQDLGNSVITSRINIKDQWASHPTLRERELNISKVEVISEENTNSAWTLFADADHLQMRVTKNLYRIAFPNSDFAKLESTEFEDFLASEVNRFKISEKYNGFYDGRYLTKFDPQKLTDSQITLTFEDVYSEANAEAIKRYHANRADLELLGQIHLKQVPTKYFEFDGKKHKRKDAGQLVKKLKEELDHQKNVIEQLDQEAFIFNRQAASNADVTEKLIARYEDYFEKLSVVQALDEINTRFGNYANRLYTITQWTEDRARQIAAELSSIEKEFKDFLLKQNIEQITSELDTASQKNTVKEYVENTQYYSKTYEFDQQAFINLSILLSDVYSACSIILGNSLKALTDFQLSLHSALAET